MSIPRYMMVALNAYTGTHRVLTGYAPTQPVDAMPQIARLLKPARHETCLVIHMHDDTPADPAPRHKLRSV